MDTTEKLLERRSRLLKTIAALGPMRRGSLTPQFVERVGKDGKKSRRGPYTLYSFKDKGKTVSRRIRERDEETPYREQIEAFRRYQCLASELVDVAQRLADVAIARQGGVKKLRGHDCGRDRKRD